MLLDDDDDDDDDDDRRGVSSLDIHLKKKEIKHICYELVKFFRIYLRQFILTLSLW
jgi:hypothetical protein